MFNQAMIVNMTFEEKIIYEIIPKEIIQEYMDFERDKDEFTKEYSKMEDLKCELKEKENEIYSLEDDIWYLEKEIKELKLELEELREKK